MFINNISPDLFTLGPLTIRFYGIVYALGFLVTVIILVAQAQKKKIKSLDKDKAVDVLTYGMVFAIIGARLFHVASEFHFYKDNLLDILAVWKGGLGFYGGIFGAILAVYLYCKKHRISPLQVLDIVVVPLPLIIGFGRIANFINSENIGKISDASWCVVFEKVDLVCRHPSQLYEAISMFSLFLVLLVLLNRKMKWKTGSATSLFFIGYGIARFITDIYRENVLYYFGLSHTQIISLFTVVIGICSLIYFQRRKVVK
jgi:phosphatidylglycerol:prolipoprotein diacylglycerol transferase